jgi:hypothetical protein
VTLTTPPAVPGELDVEKLTWLASNHPEVYKDLLEQRKLDQKRNYRLKWRDLVAQIAGHVCGLGSLVVLAFVSVHAFDSEAPTQGAAIICTGAVSIVTVFVTGRVTGQRKAGNAGEVHG